LGSVQPRLPSQDSRVPGLPNFGGSPDFTSGIPLPRPHPVGASIFVPSAIAFAVPSLSEAPPLVLLCLCRQTLTQNDQIRHGITYGEASVFRSATPLHLHKCVARFASDTLGVSCFLWERMLPGRKDSFIHGNADSESEFGQNNGV